ncbi:hypothetical protein R1sor_023837 [Riccia sorocarpa]|uniref:Myb-like domain-containing protein n=1 Tax=Riccia sorocarpa TaxID=122646 RepID=A0ABD3GQL0_9MARC
MVGVEGEAAAGGSISLVLSPESDGVGGAVAAGGVALSGGGSDGGGGEEKVRNPRWMMHETAVLVAAKRKHDEEVGDEYVPAHKKWGAIAVDVKEKGVDRDARQCRKRWSNLYQDYRRIRDWMRKTGVESYWTMRHDKRRDNKLPGSFDPEVYSDMDAFLSKKRGITPRAASDSTQPPQDEGVGSEIEQDQDGHDPVDVGSGDGSSVPGGSAVDKEQPADSAGDDKKKRNSKWTKHETVVLLVGKSKYDSKAKENSASTKAVRSDEKWDSISNYCKANGVDRDAQQCRKRWSNLHNGDYKKIRDWQKKSNVESYWAMKSEKRRQNKLPSFFDPQVYAVMDAFCSRKANGDLDGARHAFEDLLLSEVDQDHEEQNTQDGGKKSNEPPPESGTLSCREEETGLASEIASLGRKKRKRIPNGVEMDEQKGHKDHLTAILESSGKAMQVALTENIQAQIEAHKRNCELDRNQRKQQGDNLVGVLSKLAEAMAKIAEKL